MTDTATDEGDHSSRCSVVHCCSACLLDRSRITSLYYKPVLLGLLGLLFTHKTILLTETDTDERIQLSR
jgi:hypothetical protein